MPLEASHALHGQGGLRGVRDALPFRHAIELSLKQLARYRKDIAPDPDDKNEPKGNHHLTDLWNGKHTRNNGVKHLMEHVTTEGDLEVDHPLPLSVDEIDAIVRDLDRIDRPGNTFRYPETNTGKPHLPELRYINIPHLAKTIRDVSATFQAWVYGLQEEAEWYRNAWMGVVRSSGTAPTAGGQPEPDPTDEQ